MHPSVVRTAALSLVATGLPDGEVAARLGLPRTTVRDWRRGVVAERPRCPRCWRRTGPVALTAERYAELLGLYLGDGCISRVSRTWSLRISLDTRYPLVIADAVDLLAGTFPANRVDKVRTSSSRNVVVNLYHSHLPCLFPQHGPGKKHERAIVLEAWQTSMVECAPWALLRGLLRSDGCSFLNRTGRYAYLSYDFSNRSSDILDLFSSTCDSVGVAHRRYADSVRIYRRDAVDAVVRHVGVKE